ncbi:MAG: SMC-Scp complex subunit ScpB [Peptoniphilaceae bacterium]|nr:SMC-Scp complex subunit ScpB [Peptoniphilaceae bacterium]MDD7382869.1 SMC-Scp complex subunit ScpB [Peptoniphilaceae bacterium]MDY3738172.1 SMC-Scp complex subunit ScpB [Peptoniphilaceae bacterium]
MERKYLEGLLEEILYIWGEMIELDDLVKITGEKKSFIEEALLEMQNTRNMFKSGLVIKRYNDSFQLTTRPSSDKFIKKIISFSEKKLSNSALETLSIIAYKQPITRIEIDKIRGVNSSSAITNLEKRNLIKNAGRLDKIGKPILYKTTNYFLKYFDIESIDELPKLPDTNKIKEN